MSGSDTSQLYLGCNWCNWCRSVALWCQVQQALVTWSPLWPMYGPGPGHTIHCQPLGPDTSHQCQGEICEETRLPLYNKICGKHGKSQKSICLAQKLVPKWRRISFDSEQWFHYQDPEVQFFLSPCVDRLSMQLCDTTHFSVYPWLQKGSALLQLGFWSILLIPINLIWI